MPDTPAPKPPPALTQEQTATLESYRTAADAAPGDPSALGKLAAMQLQAGQLADAEKTLRALCSAAPRQVRPLIVLGNVQMQSGNTGAGIATLRAAVSLVPRDVDAHHALGIALIAGNARAEAKIVLRNAVELDPGRPHSMSQLCDLWIEDDELDLARSLLENVIAAHPENVSARYKLGYVCLLGGDFAVAEQHLSEVTKALPEYAPTYLNLGTLAGWQGRLAAAERYFRRALAMQPDFLDALDNLSMNLRAQGKYREGWQAAREHAVAMERLAQRPFADIPLWDGGSSPDTFLLVYLEQGLGDVLQFARYLHLARRRVGRILIAVEGYFEPLRRVLQDVEGVDEVLDARSTRVRVSRVCSLMHLPFLLGLDTADPETKIPYLMPRPADVAGWAQRLGPRRELRVGLVWAGGARPSLRMVSMVDARRSIAFEAMLPLLGVTDIQFVSLQLDDGPAKAANMISFAGDLRDMADTAALVTRLDLVITVDTAVAHLAGALGKPTWLLNRFDSCWRWGSVGETTAWYPSMRVLRQTSFGDWSSVIVRAARELAGLRDAHVASRQPPDKQ